ncbi:ABC transporter ATP-binding protein [Persicimonas caeni]|uniref:ABC transporter ATP-binding protein n=1 Tax=Persicimonas caeni TaxID=2292766 RepID=A0A4Y6Q2G4_PERCE|nr:ABC transporter ATP-binding protein [Persicimonas caeni]QDG54743.1 ABC transporter ATP-binding protein [Persicimonas caeni]QED35964.1 ABC transporter ATP-binding protein [Persicimonas caeni]
MTQQTDSDNNDADKPSVDRTVRNRKLWEYFSRYKGWFAIGAVFLGLTNILNLAIPAYIGDAVQMMRDAVGGEGLGTVRGDLIDIGLMIIALAIGGGIARVFSRIFIFNAGRHIEFDVRNEMYSKLGTLSAKFFNGMPTGDITSRSANDVSYIRLLYAISFLHVINTTIAYSIAMSRMADISWKLTLVCLVPYPVILYFLLMIMRALFRQTKIVQAQMSDISTKVQENLGGVSVVKCYAIEDREKESFGLMNEDYYGKSMKLATIRGGMQSLMTLVAGVGTFAVLIVGTGMVIDGDLKLGAFVEFNSYVVALAFPTIAMGWVFSVWNRGLAAFDRVLEILQIEPAVLDPAPDEQRELPALIPGEKRGAVRLENVSFAYPDEDEPVLRDIDIDIEAGSTVAIVGRTGSGKTTLVKLISRLYDPTEGTVYIDGEPLPKLPLRDTRSEVGFVSQEPFLFSMTIGQNVRFGVDALEYDETVHREPPTRALLTGDKREDVSQQERIEQAVRVAGLEPDIKGFTKGLDTLVGERGVTLSGGQKQRVTIARALLVDPRILILDDALSSVDTKTEEVILDHLDELMADRTSIILTHRFNALARVDKIFVLEDGRVVEAGSHDELLAKGGTYAEMCERQRLEESLKS